MSYRSAALGLVGGFIVITAVSMKAGMTFWGVGGFLFFYLTISVAVARVRAEFGPPSHEILWLDPARMMAVTLGPRYVGSANMTILSLYYWLNRLNVSHPMPNQLEAFKIAERTGIDVRKLVKVMMYATIAGTVVSFIAYLHVLYIAGADNVPGFVGGVGYETFNRLERWLIVPKGPEFRAISSLLTGFGVTLGLSFLKHRLIWWPLHPIGYVMTAATWGGLADFWFSVFLGWFIKIMLIKQFGFKVHRKAVPFFLGLVFGDYALTGAWSVFGIVFGMPTYVLWSP